LPLKLAYFSPHPYKRVAALPSWWWGEKVGDSNLPPHIGRGLRKVKR
jgi:hypothetical protein